MTIEITLLIALITVVLGYAGYRINRDKNVREDATKRAETNVQLAHISQGVSNIQVDLKSQAQQLTALSERQVRTEESVKVAHERIKGLEEKVSQ